MRVSLNANSCLGSNEYIYQPRQRVDVFSVLRLWLPQHPGFLVILLLVVYSHEWVCC